MSSDPATLFNEAVALHRAGQLLKAQTIYQQILQENSQDISVWRYLASALSQSGDLSQAIETLKTALAKAGPHAALHHDMGSLFLIQRAHHEAITSLRIANSLDPQNKEILLNLAQAYLQDKQFLAAENTLNFLVKTQPTFALAHFEMGRLHTLNDDQHSARDAYLEAIRYAPNFAEAYAMLGNTFLSLNNILRAIEAYTSALKIRPDLPGGYYNLALAEIANKNPQRSIEFLKQALLLTPKSAEVFSLLSQAYLENNDLDNAVTAGKTALEINPTFTPAIINLGNAFRDHGKHQEAINLYERALNKEPQNLGLLTNLGNAYLSLGNMPASNDYYRRALTLDPNHFHAKWQLGLLLLLQGQFDKGWHLYEERQHLPEFESLRRDQIAPAWHGQNLKNGTLLLWTEQGLGDSIQFVRLAQQARKFCGKIILQCPPSLKWLFQTVSGIDEVIGINEPRPTHDAQTSLMSLPALLRINPAQLPPFASYLRSNADRAAYWRHRLETLPRPWIGISWQGSLRNRSDRHRSIPLHYFAPLAHTHGALISLQQIYGLEQIATCGFEHRLTQFEEMDKGDAAFFDTAALMESLDVIVTSDTAIAHLGGALGRPTWVALQNMPDWRWMMATPTSPWYPTMRLFRQPSPGDWTSVMNFIAQELHRLA